MARTGMSAADVSKIIANEAAQGTGGADGSGKGGRRRGARRKKE